MAENTLIATIQKIAEEVNRNPEPIQGMETVYQFDIDGELHEIEIKDNTATVLARGQKIPECTLIMSEDNFYKFLSGNLSGTVAFMTGKLKVNGDMSKALKLESAFKKYDFNY